MLLADFVDLNLRRFPSFPAGTATYKRFCSGTNLEFLAPGPVGIFVLTDEREDRINNGFFVVDMRGFNPRNLNSLQLVDVPASYHNGAGGVTFADGHSEIKKWLDPRTKQSIKPGRDLPMTAASPNNRDVLWLQARSTGPAR